MRIQIVGLLPEQEELIKRKYPDVSFRFTPGYGNQAFKCCKDVEAAILMVKFTRHGQTGKDYGCKKLMCTGGMSMLASLIDGLLKEELA